MIDINETVMQNDAKEMSKDLNKGNWIVLYHANWCPHCVTFVPIFRQFDEQARKSKLPIKIAAIEQTHHNEDSIGYSPEVHGYPTLVNRNNGVDSEPYNGSRDVNSLMSFAKSKCAMKKNMKKKKTNKNPKAVIRIVRVRSKVNNANSNKVKAMIEKYLVPKKVKGSKKRKAVMKKGSSKKRKESYKF
jgi:thiol-disulfide isomerase/thioredoxin